jgi:hypothetical protein
MDDSATAVAAPVRARRSGAEAILEPLHTRPSLLDTRLVRVELARRRAPRPSFAGSGPLARPGASEAKTGPHARRVS